MKRFIDWMLVASGVALVLTGGYFFWTAWDFLVAIELLGERSYWRERAYTLLVSGVLLLCGGLLILTICRSAAKIVAQLQAGSLSPEQRTEKTAEPASEFSSYDHGSSRGKTAPAAAPMAASSAPAAFGEGQTVSVDAVLAISEEARKSPANNSYANNPYAKKPRSTLFTSAAPLRVEAAAISDALAKSSRFDADPHRSQHSSASETPAIKAQSLLMEHNTVFEPHTPLKPPLDLFASGFPSDETPVDRLEGERFDDEAFLIRKEKEPLYRPPYQAQETRDEPESDYENRIDNTASESRGESQSSIEHRSFQAEEPFNFSEKSDEPSIMGRYTSGDTEYIMFSDGSIEAQTPTNVVRFASLNELREFVEKGAMPMRSE